MKTLIVSGGIGSGKTAVCDLLKARGIPVYDCDSRAKSLYETCPGLLFQIEEALGQKFTSPDGKLDRKALSERIFSDSAAREALESILYPALLEDFKAWRSSRTESVVALESAVILSKPVFDGAGDYVIWVEAPRSERISRVMARDGMAREEVLRRIETQESCASKADIVINNDGSPEKLSRALERVLKKISIFAGYDS